MISDVKHFDLFLLGGGHANIQVLKNLAMNPIEGLRITLISDEVYAPYSGMLPGHLAGWYKFEEAHFDLRSICEKAQVRFIHDKIIGLDRSSKSVHLLNRPAMQYDFASINVGISPKPFDFVGSEKNIFPLKPIRNFLEKWNQFQLQVKNWNKNTPVRLAVIGGGAAGIEVSIVLSMVMNDFNIASKITLISKSPQLLPSHSLSAQRQVVRAVKKNGINLILGQSATHFDGSTLQLGATELNADFVFYATEAIAPEWFTSTDLPLSEHGFIKVEKSLLVQGSKELFAAGDCIDFPGSRLPKAGVYAVRQGQALVGNIRSTLLNRRLEEYRPQKNTLALLVSGQRQAIASYGSFSTSSKALWKLKDYIDRKFMLRFQSIPEMKADSKKTPSQDAISRSNYSQNTCGGCGSKVSPGILSQTIEELKKSGKYLLSEDLGEDDCSIHRFQNETIVANVDAFRTFISDPYIFAEIAAQHALNDIFAMGGIPKTAQVVVSLSEMHSELVGRDFLMIMNAIAKRLTSAGVELSGGHTVMAESTSLAFSILGTVGKPLHKKIKVGDSDLILTKPVGTGALLKANMSGAAKGRWISKIIQSMLENQSRALDVFRENNISSLTDITGFGLLGHAFEMIKQTGFDLSIDPSKVSVFEGFNDCISRGYESLLAQENMQHISQNVVGKMSDHPFLIDPQTCGGFLAVLPKNSSKKCLEGLHHLGYAESKVIGEVSSAGSGKILLI